MLLENARMRLTAATGKQYAIDASSFLAATRAQVLQRLSGFAAELENWDETSAEGRGRVSDRVSNNNKRWLRTVKRSIEQEGARRWAAAKTTVDEADLTMAPRITASILRRTTHSGVTVPGELRCTMNGVKILLEGVGGAAPTKVGSFSSRFRPRCIRLPATLSAFTRRHCG